MNHLSEALDIDLGKRHVRCIGHIINLVAHEALFGESVEAFEEALESDSAVEAELRSWRAKGPIVKLHNLIRYIAHSSNRRDVFLEVQWNQPDPLQRRDKNGVIQPPCELVRDNLTRWNSWFDAAVRALDLQASINDFVDLELDDYHAALARYDRRVSQSQGSSIKLPKAPQLLNDRLTPDDWHQIQQYVDLLRPCKVATMKLQGQVKLVSTSMKGDRPVKGAIWQVLPMFEEIMHGFKQARQRHLPQNASQPSQQPVDSQPTLTQQPINNHPSENPRWMRKRKRQTSPSSTSKHLIDPSNTHEDTPSANPSNIQDTQAEAHAHSQAEFEPHFSANINRGWQKADHYYQLTDSTPTYRAAVLLHPRMKWAWFEYRWASKPTWIAAAKEAIQELWSEYKDKPATSTNAATSPSTGSIEPEEWSVAAPQQPLDQLELYLSEGQPPTISSIDSPIPYWISKGINLASIGADGA